MGWWSLHQGPVPLIAAEARGGRGSGVVIVRLWSLDPWTAPIDERNIGYQT